MFVEFESLLPIDASLVFVPQDQFDFGQFVQGRWNRIGMVHPARPGEDFRLPFGGFVQATHHAVDEAYLRGDR